MTGPLTGSAAGPGEFGELHGELRAVARDLLGKAGAEAPDWGVLASLGWLGLEVPEELGGAGTTFAETAVVLGEMGRAAAPGPYSSVALAVGALNEVAGPGRDRLLRATAAGEVVPVLALPGEAPPGDALAREGQPGEGLDEGDGGFRLGPGLVLDGAASFVLDATVADVLLVPARDDGGAGVVVAVAPGTDGLAVTAQPVLDATRSLGHVSAHEVVVAPEAVWPLGRTRPTPWAGLRDRAAVATACDSVGLGGAMLDATVVYVGTREQFDRKIGSFQAVKHACADLLVQLTLSRTLLTAAIGAVAAARPDAGVAVAMAKAHASQTAVDVAGRALQLHGGMGYTWESGIHVYLKRAMLNRSLYGSPAWHRHRLAGRYSPT